MEEFSTGVNGFNLQLPSSACAVEMFRSGCGIKEVSSAERLSKERAAASLGTAHAPGAEGFTHSHFTLPVA